MKKRRGARDGGVLHLYKELWELTRGHRHKLVAAMLLLVGAQCVLLVVPYAAGHAINALQAEGAEGMRKAGEWLLLVVLITAGSWVLHGPGRILERNVALIVRRRISDGLIDRLLHLPLSWHEANHSGATSHRVQQSSHALSAFAQSQFIYLNSAVRLVGPVIALWCLQPAVGASAVIGFCVICLSVIGFDRAMIRLAHLENDAERRYSSTLLDSLSNSTTLFALRQARAVAALLQRRLESIFEPLKRAILLNEAKWCVVDVASKTLSCGLVALFAWLAVRHGSVDGRRVLLLGSVYMVWEYASQAGGVISSVASHFQTFARQQADYASADLIRDAALPVSSSASFVAEAKWERCEIRDVTFRHANARSELLTLDHVTLSLERGKRYALVGASGSGKSTLLRVLAGLYEADRIAVDPSRGPAIASAAEAARFFRKTNTLIPQDAEVFEASLAENLSLCDAVSGDIATEADYLSALKIARVTDFIPATKDGLELPIAERAANWSGGQRARVALARGLLAAKGSALVLFDEPTASLDPKTESAVYENVFAHLRDACVISSIHRLNLLSRFDEVLVMHNGRLVAQGPASVLTATSPISERFLPHIIARTPSEWLSDLAGKQRRYDLYRAGRFVERSSQLIS